MTRLWLLWAQHSLKNLDSSSQHGRKEKHLEEGMGYVLFQATWLPSKTYLRPSRGRLPSLGCSNRGLSQTTPNPGICLMPQLISTQGLVSLDYQCLLVVQSDPVLVTRTYHSLAIVWAVGAQTTACSLVLAERTFSSLSRLL